MKKFSTIIVLILFLTNNLYAENIHLKCKYDDGSGKEYIFIDKNKKLVKWSNESKEDQYRIFYYPGDPINTIVAVADTNVEREQMLSSKKSIDPKDIHLYMIKFKSLEIDLFQINNNNSNKAKIYYTNKNIYLYADERNEERIFMPTKEKLKNSLRGKDLSSGRLGRLGGMSAVLNCLKN